jgi:putative transcriptional regulator
VRDSLLVIDTTGKLLIAEPLLDDPNFDRAVVLVVEHSDEGALGLVLNRPTEIAVAEALPPWAELATEPAMLYIGGPVEERSGWCLARARRPDSLDSFVPVVDDLGLVDLSEDPLALRDELSHARLYAGYSGWGAGQLDSELALGGWFVVEPELGDPFHDEGPGLWHRVLARQPGTLSALSLVPRDPSVN